MERLHGKVVFGRLLNKTHGLNAIQSKTHWAIACGLPGLPRAKISKKSRSKTLMKTMPKPCDSDHFGLGRVGEYFTDFSNQNAWGKYNKSKNDLSFLI